MKVSIKLRLPKIHMLVNNDVKLDDTNSRKYVHVVAGHAIVSNNGLIVIVDLREYFKRELDITEEDDLSLLTEIVNWMEGKAFAKEYWSELTSEQFVKVTPEGFEIEKINWNQNLIYESIDSNTKDAFQSILDNIMRAPVTVDRISISSDLISSLTKALAGEMKGDNFIFDFCGKDKSLKFTMQRRDYIFGIIATNFESGTEFTAFNNVSEFRDKLQETMLEE